MRTDPIVIPVQEQLQLPSLSQPTSIEQIQPNLNSMDSQISIFDENFANYLTTVNFDILSPNFLLVNDFENF